jgi:hypothetical protein
MKIIRCVIVLMLIGNLTSCSEDEAPDFVGESVGSYSYSARLFDADNTVAGTLTGTLVLSRNGDDLTIIVDGDETLKSSRLELASNGYGFDIEASVIKDVDGDLVNRSGNTAATLDGKSYHGRYDTGAKQLFINVSYIYQDAQFSEFNSSVEVTATKK